MFFNRNEEQENKPRRKMGCLGKTLIAIALYILLTIITYWYAGSLMTTPETKLEDNSVYYLKMEGTVVEQGQEDNPLMNMMGEMNMPLMQQPKNIVGLDDLRSNILLAKDDSRIKGIVLTKGQFNMGPATAKALRDALIDYKTSGKWLIAYAEEYGELDYYVASVADKIYLNPIGSVSWHGFSAQKTYYTRLLEKIGVRMQILKVGSFKSAVEPFFRTSMSEEDKEQTMHYIGELWRQTVDAVSQSRGISAEDLNEYADMYMGVQSAELNLQYGLVDSLVYADQLDSIVASLVACTDYQRLSTSKMTHVKREKKDVDNSIAVVYAEGQIYDEQGEGIVATDMLKTLKKVGKNKSVKAVVLRVNSPGGSANASEYIWHAVQVLREQGLKVVVSMGDYAASGGYYISCGSDYIYAEPSTLTGSIGIFGVIPDISKLFDKIGLDTDGVSTNRYSGLWLTLVTKGMNPEEQQLMQQMIERGYDTFTSRCALGRGLSQDSIKAIGEGRVWLGTDAVKLGLVDELGGINEAVKKAAELADVADYKVVYYPKKKDVWMELMNIFDDTTEEERLIATLREFASKPRVMALAPVCVIK